MSRTPASRCGTAERSGGRQPRRCPLRRHRARTGVRLCGYAMAAALRRARVPAFVSEPVRPRQPRSGVPGAPRRRSRRRQGSGDGRPRCPLAARRQRSARAVGQRAAVRLVLAGPGFDASCGCTLRCATWRALAPSLALALFRLVNQASAVGMPSARGRTARHLRAAGHCGRVAERTVRRTMILEQAARAGRGRMGGALSFRGGRPDLEH